MRISGTITRVIARLPHFRGQDRLIAALTPSTSFPPSDIVTTHFGAKMRVVPSDNTVERRVYRYGYYEWPITHLFSRILPHICSFWDVGAHIGYYTVMAGRLLGKPGKVFAFEPHPHALVRLRENVSLNCFSNVVVLQYGLSNVDKDHRVIFDAGPSVLAAPTFVAGRYDRSIIECELRRGDDVVAESNGLVWHPDVVKLDIEGYELFALEGMGQILSGDSPPVIVCEINQLLLGRLGIDGHDVLEFLSDCNDYVFYQDTFRGWHSRAIDWSRECFNIVAFCPSYHQRLVRGGLIWRH